MEKLITKFTNQGIALSKVLKKTSEKIDTLSAEDGARQLTRLVKEATRVFDQVRESYDEIIEGAKEDKQIEDAMNGYEEHAELFDEVTARANKKINELQPPIVASEPVEKIPEHRTNEVKLPTIHIEPFNGDFANWPAFCDMFTALVHSKTYLSGAEKLQLLKNSLRDSAANRIANLSVTNENYVVAWELLKSKYENKRRIIGRLVAQLMDIGKISNARNLPDLVDKVQATYRAIEALKISPENVSSYLFCHIVAEKLDSETSSTWEKKQNGEVPKLNDLLKFLEEEVAHIADEPRDSYQRRNRSDNNGYNKSSSPPCPACQQAHKPYFCDIFKRTSVQDRFNLIKSSRRCVNCLELGHMVIDCRAFGCKKCQKKHHTLLHDDKYTSAASNQSKSDPNKPSTSSSVNTAVQILDQEKKFTLLGTAIVNIMNSEGKFVPARALLDLGSQSNIITTQCARNLGLPLRPSSLQIVGIGSSSSTVKGEVKMELRNDNGDFNYAGEAFVMEEITCDQPSIKLCGELSVAKGLDLADKNFMEPGPIDVLLGADLYMKAMRNGRRNPKKGEPGAINTAFGWTITGSVPRECIQVSQERFRNSSHIASIDPSRFWAMEEVPKVQARTKEDKTCEEIYKQTTVREGDGKYIVRLPMACIPPDLGESRVQAARRFYGLERKFKSNPVLAEEYKNVINEYLELDHLEEVPTEESEKSGYYIPHHAIVKESRKTTKVRVVFDASAKSSNGKSLNDNLFTGPRLQEELFSILVRFRTHKIALTADIEKMYRMVMVHPDDRKFQKILWRSSPNERLREYQLTRVAFGVRPAPFLAIRTLHQLAADEEKNYPEASKVLTHDFYVDDLLSGADDPSSVKKLQKDLSELLNSGGFNLTKWTCNQQGCLSGDTSDAPINLQPEDEPSKTLGLFWHPKRDQFRFSYDQVTRSQHTKRTMLSDLAKLFDPLGWLSPVTISGKIIFQEMWRLNLDWDAPVPPSFQEKWNIYLKSLENVKSLQIDRCIKGLSGEKYVLCGFSDASEAAYAACVYLCTYTGKKCDARLIAAKTKVASLHATPLPRLELCGALLLAQLLESIERALRMNISEIHAFTDSKITLQWITNDNVRWKTFVANRVAAIHEAVPTANWHFIPGKENIADCISRGIPAADLPNLVEWWNGPECLKSVISTDKEQFEPSTEAKEEAKKVTVFHVTTARNHEFQEKYSDFTRLQRHTAVWLRFMKLLQKKPYHKGHFTVAELQEARKVLLREIQRKSNLTIENWKEVTMKHKLLNPIIGNDGLIRVGGRLKNAELGPDQKQPVLLPKDAHLSKLIVMQAHQDTLHGGPQVMMANVRHLYWIIGLKHLVKRAYSGCIKCQRIRATACQQLMGDLPKSRVTQARPFQRTGCDFMGPFWMKTKTGRGAKKFKAYAAIFVCFTTRAIHLELVSDMTTAAFLAALRRFIARRGKPSEMFSDLGTNIVGGNNELQEYMKIASSEARNEEVADNIAKLGIQWHFNPGGAPHFGGLWEAGVKSTKYHLKRIVGETSLTFEEFHTVLCQVEAVLNSRPLVEMSSDPSDYLALTPGHFLVGDALTAHPEPNYEAKKESHLSRWSLLQKMVQHFWRRWHNEYLTRLQQRPKWTKPLKDLRIGELVLLKEDNIPPLQWRLARIVEVHPGADGHVRVVTVRTVKGLYKRPISKVCRLPDTSE